MDVQREKHVKNTLTRHTLYFSHREITHQVALLYIYIFNSGTSRNQAGLAVHRVTRRPLLPGHSLFVSPPLLSSIRSALVKVSKTKLLGVSYPQKDKLDELDCSTIHVG